MATTVNIHAAKTHLSKLIERVEAGEEIVIARNGRPAAKLVPVQPSAPKRGWVGLFEGESYYMSPDFDETPADVLAMMEGDDRLADGTGLAP